MNVASGFKKKKKKCETIYVISYIYYILLTFRFIDMFVQNNLSNLFFRAFTSCFYKKILLYHLKSYFIIYIIPFYNTSNIPTFIIAHPWCDGHFTSINACEVWGARVGIQVSKREFHTHIHLDQARIEILSCIKKKNIPTSIFLFNSLK